MCPSVCNPLESSELVSGVVHLRPRCSVFYRERNVTRRGPGHQEKEDMPSVTEIAGGCTPKAFKGIALQTLTPGLCAMRS